MVSFRQAEDQSMKALEDRREQTRRDFFKGREDITPGRLDRRQIQADLLEKFKKEQMKPVAGASGVLQSVRPGGPTTADETMRLARMYGPTLKEIGSDIGYGIRSIGSALGQKFAAGELGIMGIAKSLYEKFSNAVNVSKKAIGDQINKLSDIDLEILKNKDKYSYTSKKPNLVNIDQLEKNAQQAAANRDYFGTYFSYGGSSMPGEVERQTIKPIIPSTLYGMPQQPPGFKVMSPEQKALLEEMNKADALNSGGINNIQIQNGQGSVITDQQMNDAINKSNEIFGNDSIFGTSSTYNPNKGYLQQQDDYYYQDKERFSPQGNQYLYADASQEDINKISTERQFKKMSPDQIYEMRDVFGISPDITLDEIQKIKEGTLTQPTGQYAANGGMIEKRLGDIQKKTNNIYGTGILSVR